MKIHKIISVRETYEDGTFVVVVDSTDSNGERGVKEYISRDDDPYGNNPAIRTAIMLEWGGDIDEEIRRTTTTLTVDMGNDKTPISD